MSAEGAQTGLEPGTAAGVGEDAGGVEAVGRERQEDPGVGEHGGGHGAEDFDERIVGPAGAAFDGEEDDGFAREGGIAHEPVERVFEGAGESVGVLGGGDDDGTGGLHEGAKTGDGRGERDPVAVEVGIEMGQGAQVGEMSEGEIGGERGEGVEDGLVGRGGAETATEREDRHGEKGMGPGARDINKAINLH